MHLKIPFVSTGTHINVRHGRIALNPLFSAQFGLLINYIKIHTYVEDDYVCMCVYKLLRNGLASTSIIV